MVKFKRVGLGDKYCERFLVNVAVKMYPYITIKGKAVKKSVFN